MMDKFDLMFEKQRKLQAKFGINDAMDESAKQKYINQMTLAAIRELTEALEETPWKNPQLVEFGWKKTSTGSQELFKEELVDVFHFFMNLMIAAEMTPEELWARYQAKHQVNLERRSGGY